MQNHPSSEGDRREETTISAPLRAGDRPNRRAIREVIPTDRESSVRFSVHDDPHPYARWNFHPEYEVHLILASSGRYVLGDAVGSYAPGQLVLVGPNLPHQWVRDDEPRDVVPDAHAVLHFTDGWIRACQDAMPELRALDPMLRRSTRGIEFLGASRDRGAEALRAVSDASDGMQRVVAVLDVLRTLAMSETDEVRDIAHDEAPLAGDDNSSALVGRAVDYILANLTTGVHLHEAARLAAMSDSAFSRYFKAASGQTFTHMVRKLRLTQACRLLESTDEPIAWIATEVGYANLSNFNRQFLAAYDRTPRQYRREASTVSAVREKHPESGQPTGFGRRQSV